MIDAGCQAATSSVSIQLRRCHLQERIPVDINTKDAMRDYPMENTMKGPQLYFGPMMTHLCIRDDKMEIRLTLRLRMLHLSSLSYCSESEG
jgi:hypothetical protein